MAQYQAACQMNITGDLAHVYHPRAGLLAYLGVLLFLAICPSCAKLGLLFQRADLEPDALFSCLT